MLVPPRRGDSAPEQHPLPRPSGRLRGRRLRPGGSQRPGSHERRPPRPGSYSRHAPPGGFQTLTTASPPSPPACPSNRRWPAPHWPGPAPPRADWPRSSGPASALAATSILMVEAGGGRLSDVGWSAASSSALVGFVRSLPHLSLEREGGLDVEREPPQSELEVGEWRRRGHVGRRAPHCWGPRRGAIREPGGADPEGTPGLGGSPAPGRAGRSRE
ncbi:proline-rich proteoglycan 2-like [Marmota marmota marmota]|uniref:proline-rich proteoglycan 2-like n=1 Tax=Marmota marmota marmota TaxID=9994 RepID=UPI002092E0EA|nr:proline-rich proteoglycan 2-like [Marmota marmota marmota]